MPEFRCCKLDHPHAGPQHVGTIHIGSERYVKFESYFIFCGFMSCLIDIYICFNIIQYGLLQLATYFFLEHDSFLCPCLFPFSMEEIHSACQDAVNGVPSRRPVIEMSIPSILDKTISPPGT